MSSSVVDSAPGALSWQERYLRRWYSRDRGWVDGTTKYHLVCESALNHLNADLSLLEIGSGPPNDSSRFLASLGHLTGVDTDSVVFTNPDLASAYVVLGETLPFESETFDACYSNWVLEHIEQPMAHLEEVKRVLKPGGKYVARTPNLAHYVSFIASATPHWFHALVANRLRRLPEESHQPWPTFYRLNSGAAIKEAAAAAGLEVERLDYIESEPSYGMASRALFLVFMAYERLVNASPRLAFLRHTIVIELKRPESRD